LRIAVLNRHFSKRGGGAERYSVALVEALAARHDIHVFAQDIQHTWPGVTYHQISMPLRKPRWLNQLWFAAASWLATRRDFDVVHSHENTWHGNVQTVHVLPVKYTLFQGRRGWWVLLRWLQIAISPRLLTYLWLERSRLQARPERQVIVTSQTLLPVLAAAYPHSAPVQVLAPGIDAPNLPVTSEQKAAARASLGLPPGGFLLLFVGNDYRKKGLTSLLAALARLPDPIGLIVAGSESQRAAFEAQAIALKIDSRLHFVGSLPDMAPAYKAADCLVHPTLEDTFAMVVLEAMSYALPVVVSSAQYCGIAALLTAGVDALVLSDPRDADALASAIDRVFHDAALRNRLASQARAFAVQHQWTEVAAKQEAIYEEVVQRKREAILKSV
jgi:glycosyltransferase involved in cell wall biosynthesis